MHEIVAALTEQQRELAGLLAGRDDADWQLLAPRCPGWTVADVVLHLAQTDEFAVASTEGRFPEGGDRIGSGEGRPSRVDEYAERLVAEQRDVTVPELRDRWQTGADAIVTVLAATDPHRRVTWVAGQFSARTLAATRLAETWIHTGDVADAFGVALTPGDRLRYVARLAWRTLPYAFDRAERELHGPVAFELRGPNGDAWSFVPDVEPLTVIRGDGVELCMVAARRLDPADSTLLGEGPDADAVLDLVRTYA